MFEVQNWGLIDYLEAWEKQKELVADIQQNRDKNVLVLCQHPTVITIGKNGSKDNVLLSDEELKQNNVKVVLNNRGGDVTLHNPHQLVGYPIFNLSSLKEDLHWFLRTIEEVIIELVAKYGIVASRVAGLTGVWVDSERKICAMGLHCSRWVTSHGFALNVNNNISEFNFIVPCGIEDKKVTSIAKELDLQKPTSETGTSIAMSDIEVECIRLFEKHFFSQK